MASVNKVILVGNVGRDPDIRYTQGGEPIANFSIATSEQWTDTGGQKQERTEWHNVEVFGKLAQIVRDYVQKGKQVYVEGSIRTNEYRDKDGNQKKTTRVRLSGPQAKLVLLGGNRGGGAETPTRQAAPPEDFQATDDDVPFVWLLPILLPLVPLFGSVLA